MCVRPFNEKRNELFGWQIFQMLKTLDFQNKFCGWKVLLNVNSEVDDITMITWMRQLCLLVSVGFWFLVFFLSTQTNKDDSDDDDDKTTKLGTQERKEQFIFHKYILIPLMYDECRAQDAQLQAAIIFERTMKSNETKKWNEWKRCPGKWSSHFNRKTKICMIQFKIFCTMKTGNLLFIIKNQIRSFKSIQDRLICQGIYWYVLMNSIK